MGGAIHLGLAEWYKGNGLDGAIAAIEAGWPVGMPVDDYRTLEKAKDVMKGYVKQYPMESWKVVGAPAQPMVEQVFTLPTGMYLPCTGYGASDPCGFKPDSIVEAVEWLRTPDFENPWGINEDNTCPNCGAILESIDYGGVIDLIVEMGNQLYISDHKTTSQLGSYYFYQFKPNNQISGYVWAAGQLSSRPIGGAFINAIGIYKVGATKFAREFTSRTATNIREWLVNLWHSCVELRHHEQMGYFPMRTRACTMYGTCQYYEVHSLASEDERRRMLEQSYVQRKWDWETRDGD
jgi:hypothetical protein